MPTKLNTEKSDCPVGTKLHEAHDNLIVRVQTENIELKNRVKQLDGVIKMANAQTSKSRHKSPSS